MRPATRRSSGGGSLEGVDTGFEQKMALVTGKNVKSTMQGVETSSEESVSEQKQIETETRTENASSSEVEEGINGEEEDDDDNDEEGEEEGSDVPSAEEVDDDGEDGSDDNDNDEEGTEEGGSGVPSSEDGDGDGEDDSNANRVLFNSRPDALDFMKANTDTMVVKLHPSVLWTLAICHISSQEPDAIHWSIPDVNHNDVMEEKGWQIVNNILHNFFDVPNRSHRDADMGSDGEFLILSIVVSVRDTYSTAHD